MPTGLESLQTAGFVGIAEPDALGLSLTTTMQGGSLLAAGFVSARDSPYIVLVSPRSSICLWSENQVFGDF